MSQANPSSSLGQNETIFCCDVCKNPLLLMEAAGASTFSFMKNASHWFVLLHMVSYIILLSWCSTHPLTISISLICHNLFKIKCTFLEVEVLAGTTTLFKFLDIITTEGRKKQLTWEICFVFSWETLLNWSRNSEWFLCFALNAMSHLFVLFFCLSLMTYLGHPASKSSNSLLWWITTQDLDVSNESYLTL